LKSSTYSGCGTEIDDCHKRVFPERLGWGTCCHMRKGGGHFEDVVFKKVISFVVYFKIFFIIL